jgi:23S rRNA (adenine2503-C2)-methyltransferase
MVVKADKDKDIASLTREALKTWFVERAEKPFRADQVFRWVHRKCAVDFVQMTDLSREMRARLPDMAELRLAEIESEQTSRDGTIKFRFRLFDGRFIEGVYMPDERRRTLCVSTQVGCAMGCSFCATGTMGLVRNLSAGEITGQIEAVVRRLRTDALPRPVSNVVFMGMGEPLANLDAVCDAVHNLLDDSGLGLSRRHITVSTVGLLPAMEAFVHRVPVKLAVSLNATTDEQRDGLMPINRKYPLDALLRVCRNLPLSRVDRVTFEYVMLKGVNDTDDDARRLVKLLQGVRAKVNLIPYNPYAGLPYERPDDQRVNDFLEYLASKQISAFVRRSRGTDLQAACGQLVAGG